MPPVYVVILAHGGQVWLERFLPSVLHTNYPNFTIWLLDNASQPSLVEWSQLNFPTLRVIRYEKNEGYAGAYQRFFSAHGKEVPYIALLNSDIEVTPSWLQPLIDQMERIPRLAAIQPKILSWKDRAAFEYAGAAGGFLDSWGYPICRGRGEKDKGQYDKASRIFWVSGAACVIRTAAIWETQGGLLFKPYYFMHMEEIDLCWRLQRAGYWIGYEPNSVVYHVGGASLASHNPQKVYFNFRNSLYLLWENLSGWEKKSFLLRRLLLDAPAAIYLLFKGGFPHFWAVIKAHRDFFRRIIRGTREASLLPSLPSTPYKSLEGVAKGSYYIGTVEYPWLPLS
ncbi:MAG: glycosyltransferase family 2 protein [Bacteroidia bacterium]|nr:glycosyltransferase family 2 protein [Bacteroidia bacterium]MDW8134919.1 glycosyltransferase family 2 protein [Bacteroidia bacterium]